MEKAKYRSWRMLKKASQFGLIQLFWSNVLSASEVNKVWFCLCLVWQEHHSMGMWKRKKSRQNLTVLVYKMPPELLLSNLDPKTVCLYNNLKAWQLQLCSHSWFLTAGQHSFSHLSHWQTRGMKKTQTTAGCWNYVGRLLTLKIP